MMHRHPIGLRVQNKHINKKNDEHNAMAKYSRYQDYVIRDGKFVGDFDQMYQDFDDPWEQSSREAYKSEKALAVNAVARLKQQAGAKTVLELGSGLGHFSGWLAKTGCNVYGIECSKTAVRKAKRNYPMPPPRFICADIADKDVYEKLRPDIIVMSEVTWYILPILGDLLTFFKRNFPGIYLIHLLTVYAADEQKYGAEYFTDLKGIMEYFNKHGLTAIEFGECCYSKMSAKRTYLIGQW